MINKCSNSNFEDDSGDESDVVPFKKRNHTLIEDEESASESEGSSDGDWTSESEEEIDDNENNEQSHGSEYESEEETTDSDSEDESESDTKSNSSQVKKAGGPSKVIIDSDSDSDKDGQRETCAICLSFMKGEIGSPELCDHSFCLECILEWAKTNNSCPQDRTQFLQVFVRKRVKGRIIRTITVQEVKPDDVPAEDDEDPTFCEICGRCDREDTLLLCDGCDSGHHLECLTPPLTTVPINEWYCQECEALNRERNSHEVNIEIEEVTELIDDAGFDSNSLRGRRRRMPRTRASERVRRIITRARTLREDVFESLGSSSEEESNVCSLEVSSTSRREVNSTKESTNRRPASKVTKVVIKRKKKTIRKVTKKRTRKTKKRTANKTKRKRKVCKVKGRRTGKPRKTTKRRKRKFKKRTMKKKTATFQPVVTPKARLAEALGIRPLKNPWQLGLPSMTGSIGQSSNSLTNQRWRAGVPSLSLLGSNSELDYLSEPDEFGDTILVAGVRRRNSLSSEALVRRKEMAAKIFRSGSSLNQHTNNCLTNLPISDNSISSAGDLLGNIIESQTQLHNRTLNPRKLTEETLRGKVKTAGVGPNAPSSQHTGNDGNRNSNRNSSLPNQPSNNSYSSQIGEGSNRGFSFSLRSPTNGDPMGSAAYTSYLQSHSSDSNDRREVSPLLKRSKKEDEKKKNEDELDLYSDIELEGFNCGVDDDDNDADSDNKNPKELIDNDDSPLSGDNELVIDDSIKLGDAKEGEGRGTNKNSSSCIAENEVGSSNLLGLNNFELEEVSDVDSVDMNKSINSSISLSDNSNIGDSEVTSSTGIINPGKFSSNNISDGERRNRFLSEKKRILGDLDTEVISDNEEMCFDDNYEEGEILSESPSLLPRALPSNRPRINIQLKKFLEVNSPNKEFDGDCEEGEIVDDLAAQRERREKAKKAVDEIVNQSNQSTEVPTTSNNNNSNDNANTQNESETGKEKLDNLQVKMFVSDSEISSDQGFALPKKPQHSIRSDTEKLSSQCTDKSGTLTSSSCSDKEKSKDISFKKISSNNKVRNYRESDQESSNSRRRGRSKDKHYSCERSRTDRNIDRNKNEKLNRDSKSNRERGNKDDGGRRKLPQHNKDKQIEKDNKKDSKRKEIELYNVRQMITKRTEEKKRTDEFGRDITLRSTRPRSRSVSRGRNSSKSKRTGKPSTKSPQVKRSARRFSRSRSRSRHNKYRRRRSYSISSSTSSSSTSSSSSSSSSSYSSSSSSSRSRSRSRTPKRSKERKRRITRSRSKSPSKKKKTEKKKAPVKEIEKPKKVVDLVSKKKEDNEKKSSSKEDEIIKLDKQKKKKKKEKSPLQSKEVYQAGGSIMISVNFSQKNQNKEKDPTRKKDSKDDPKKTRPDLGTVNSSGKWTESHGGGGIRPHSPDGKHTPLQDEPMWSPRTLHHESRTLDPRQSGSEGEVIMVTPTPDEPILISDSDDEGITRLPPDLGVSQRSSLIPRGQGPKTPPEPSVKFTLSSKQSFKSLINNPLHEDMITTEIIPSRGPNTPPGPPPESDEPICRHNSPSRRIPRSPAGTPPASSPEPDVYDPFEPTKSPSPLPPLPSPQQEQRVSSSDQAEAEIIEIISPTKTSTVSDKIILSPLPLSIPSDSPLREETLPEPCKVIEDEATSTVVSSKASQHTLSSVAIGVSQSITPNQPVSAPTNTVASSINSVISLPGIQNMTASQIVNPVQQIFASLPANVANILYPAALAAAALRGATSTLIPPTTQSVISTPDLSRPPPPTVALLSRPPPTTPVKTDKNRINQNGQQNVDSYIEGDINNLSPNSPDSSDVSDIFEPPSPRAAKVDADNKTHKSRHSHSARNVSPTKVSSKSLDKFDALFGSSSDLKSSKSTVKTKGSDSVKTKQKITPGGKLEIEDDIPNSAVDLQVKEKLLKKVQRQERVVDEVKLCLKPYYNKKVITKEDYKDIMKRCVQKVCHNRSGEINPHKIRGLVEGYVKKVKYYRKKIGSKSSSSSIGILSQMKFGAASFPPAISEHITNFGSHNMSKSHVKVKP